MSSLSSRGMLVLFPAISSEKLFASAYPCREIGISYCRVVYSLYFPIVSSKFPKIFFQISAFLIDLVINCAFFSQVYSKFPRIFFQISLQFPPPYFTDLILNHSILKFTLFKPHIHPALHLHTCNEISWYEKGCKFEISFITNYT